jgi:ABC-type polysaccharide/polyol phosphate transport system ATPase subunit
MKQYDVINREMGYNKVFYNLNDAKKAMKANNARGFITQICANGDWINHGEIKATGSNKTFTANTKQAKQNY